MSNIKSTVLSITAKVFSFFLTVYSRPLLLYAIRSLWYAWYGLLCYLIIYHQQWSNTLVWYTINIYILPIIIAIMSLSIVTLVILQRNEDGIFQRPINNGGMDSASMFRQTISMGTNWILHVAILTKMFIVAN